MSERPLAPDDAALHAYVDGRLDAVARAEVDAYLAGDPDLAARLEIWQAQNEALRAQGEAALAEPVPDALLEPFRQQSLPGRAWAGSRALAPRIAALLLVAVLGAGAGWWARGEMPGARQVGAVSLPREASRAHLLYTAEVLHPVEVTAAEEKHLVAWLSKRLGRELKVPALGDYGFSLVGGRLLPSAARAEANDLAAQFMYENRRGDRLTLYVRRGETRGGDTAFRFSQADGVAGFYWVDEGFGYALEAKLEREALLPIARTVYQQLN